MPLIDLPIEVYGTIADLLAGDQAFGTLASLNLTSRAVREETLPVLFETLLFDDYVELAQWMRKRSHVPIGFRHTKFFLAATGSSLGDTYDWLHLLPNLALTVSLGAPPPGQTCFDYYIRLFKPLKPITVFGHITKTRLSPRLLKGLAKAGTAAYADGRLSHSSRLMRFVLEHGAYFIAENPASKHAVEWTTNITLENSYFVEDAGSRYTTAVDAVLAPNIRPVVDETTSDGQIADTICELLKLTIRPCPTIKATEGRQLGIIRYTRLTIDKLFDKLPTLLANDPQLLTRGIWIHVQADYADAELTDALHRIQATVQQPLFFKQQSTALFDRSGKRAIVVLEKENDAVAPPELQEEGMNTYWQVALYMTVEGPNITFSVE